jgi:flagellar hook-associated protein 3 FlgL
MISSASAIGSDWFLNGIATLQREQLKTEQDISSGYRVRDASDAPAQTPALVDLGSQLAAAQTYQSNIGRVQAETSAAEQAIASTITLIDSARSLATQGASSTTSATDRQYLALQVQSYQQQVVNVGNTSVEGRFIFGGDQDQQPPYAYDAASANGVDKLTTQVSTRVFVSPAGQTVYLARTAATIFDHSTAAGAPAADNVFSALQGLVTALQANDPVGVAASITSLKTASDWLNQQQASYGVDVNRLQSEQNTVANSITSLQTRISAIRDTDISQAATDLSLEQTAQSAAFGAQARISQKSLFDYLA